MTTSVVEPQETETMRVMQDPNVVKLYVNGLTVGISLSDVFMIVKSGPTPSAVIQMSFTTAKTMMLHLTDLITRFEKDTGQTLLTMEDVKEKCYTGDLT
ncbi:MAG: hypothetical protein V2B18_14850 [Pseudomonadota bacterium]